jgi:hypothetical protein
LGLVGVVGPVDPVEIVGRVVLEGIHKVEMEEGGDILDLVADTILAELHMACQEIQDLADQEDQEGRRDPNLQVEEGRTEDTGRVDQMEVRQEGHLEVKDLVVEFLAAQVLVDFEVEPVLELVLEGEFHSV